MSLLSSDLPSELFHISHARYAGFRALLLLYGNKKLLFCHQRISVKQVLHLLRSMDRWIDRTICAAIWEKDCVSKEGWSSDSEIFEISGRVVTAATRELSKQASLPLHPLSRQAGAATDRNVKIFCLTGSTATMMCQCDCVNFGRESWTRGSLQSYCTTRRAGVYS